MKEEWEKWGIKEDKGKYNLFETVLENPIRGLISVLKGEVKCVEKVFKSKEWILKESKKE